MKLSKERSTFIRYLYGFIIFVAYTFCCFYWFDWKLFVVLMLFGWMMNVENKNKRIDRLERKLTDKDNIYDEA